MNENNLFGQQESNNLVRTTRHV